jgi:hypothetical protein
MNMPLRATGSTVSVGILSARSGESKRIESGVRPVLNVPPALTVAERGSVRV